jgi:TolA-binding protein
MRRTALLVPLLVAFAAPGLILLGQPAPDAPPKENPAAEPAGRAPKIAELLNRIEELLKTRQERTLEQVRKIVDQELQRAAEEQRKRQEERRALADQAGRRAQEIGKKIKEMRDAADKAIARAGEALGEKKPEPAAEEKEEAAEKPARPQVPEPYRKLLQTMRLYESGDYEKAIAGFAESLKGLEAMNTAEARRYRAEALYHTACAHAVLGRADTALQTLDRAIRAGFRNLDKMENDAELDPLREDPRFERIERYARSLKG